MIVVMVLVLMQTWYGSDRPGGGSGSGSDDGKGSDSGRSDSDSGSGSGSGDGNARHIDSIDSGDCYWWCSGAGIVHLHSIPELAGSRLFSSR